MANKNEIIAEPASPPPVTVPAPDIVSKKVLGWLFGGVLLLLVLLLVYFVFFILAPLTRPSPYFEQLTKALSQRTSAAVTPDALTVDIAVMLEYAAADIRMAGVQIAFAIVGGLFFAAVGVLLLGAGVTGTIKLGAKLGTGEVTVGAAVPGAACLAFGAVIVGFGVIRDVSRPFRGEVNRPVGMHYESDVKLAPPTARTDEPDDAVTESEKAGLTDGEGAMAPL
jgi:hypothetical protein